MYMVTVITAHWWRQLRMHRLLCIISITPTYHSTSTFLFYVWATMPSPWRKASPCIDQALHSLSLLVCTQASSAIASSFHNPPSLFQCLKRYPSPAQLLRHKSYQTIVALRKYVFEGTFSKCMNTLSTPSLPNTFDFWAGVTGSQHWQLLHYRDEAESAKA